MTNPDSGQISRPRPHAADQKGLKGRSRGQNLAEILGNFGKIDFARFGPNMAHNNGPALPSPKMLGPSAHRPENML